jgi:predicted porin
MQKSVLTAAIAAALAVPMAAQAVEVTLSGHVNRALFITDSDSGTKAYEGDNGSSGSRFRFTGSGEMMDGRSAGIKLEYGAGGDGGAGLSLRYADLNFAGEFGKVSIGHGDQAGESSVYNDKSGTIGIAHGQDFGGSTLSGYFGSLDGGGSRNGRIRYDTPAFGPVGVAVSIGNSDQVSAGITLSQEFGGTAFSAALGTLMHPGDANTVSASAGVKLPSGITFSGTWGNANDMAGAAGTAAVAAIPEHFRSVDIAAEYALDSDAGTALVENGNFDLHMGNLRDRIDLGKTEGADAVAIEDGEAAKGLKRDLFAMAADCNPAADDGVDLGGPANETDPMCGERMYPAMDGSAATPDHVVDPSFFQATLGYVLGDTSVAVSWWQTSDFQRAGSDGTAIGIGVNHNLPKIGANVYAAAQNYAVNDGATDTDDTVVMIGTRIKF